MKLYSELKQDILKQAFVHGDQMKFVKLLYRSARAQYIQYTITLVGYVGSLLSYFVFGITDYQKFNGKMLSVEFFIANR